jgi:localization factor PodJL
MGTGVAVDERAAVEWFRRAAEAGLQDSQYNLARLYEQGYGVTQNAAEAYKWYLIAGAGGDAEARSSAERLKATLSPDSQAAAQRSAAAYRAQAVRTAQAN